MSSGEVVPPCCGLLAQAALRVDLEDEQVGSKRRDTISSAVAIAVAPNSREALHVREMA